MQSSFGAQQQQQAAAGRWRPCCDAVLRPSPRHVVVPALPEQAPQPAPPPAAGPRYPWQRVLGVAGCAAAAAGSLLLCGPALQPALAAQLPVSRIGAAAAVAQQPGRRVQAEWLQQQQEPQGPQADVASETEDRLLTAVRQLEARVGGVVGRVVPSLPGSHAPTQQEADAADAAARSLIQEVWELVDGNYLDARSSGWQRDKWAALRDEALARRYTDMGAVHRALREMVAFGLQDPYCRFILPSELAAMKKYDVTGVGLNLGTAEEFTMKTKLPLPPGGTSGVFVVGLSRGSPSDQAGVEQGDQILEVDGSALGSASPFQVSSLIAGAQDERSSSASSNNAMSTATVPRPFVDLKVRKASGRELDVRVARPVRQLSTPVTSRLVTTGSQPTGMLQLSSFNARAQSDMAAAIRGLEQQGAQSLVLDLRDNRGGLVSEGLEVARLFLEGSSPLVYTESRSIPGDPPRATGPALTRLPLMVLVNEHTASASEIVAGALQDNCRAVLVGSRTYGKGLIQSVYELSDNSGMVLTVGKYLTPNHTDIDRAGIKPDFKTAPSLKDAQQALSACKQAPR